MTNKLTTTYSYYTPATIYLYAISLILLYTNLTGYTDFSYWIVFIPLWAPVALILLVAIFTLIAMLVLAIFEKRK